jgi:acetyl esterase/lipase
MRIRKKWLRDLCSIVFSVYYLIAAEQADEKVRKVRGALTLDHLRVSWNKGTTPYLAFASALLRSRLMKYPPRAIRIPRPPGSDYKEPVNGWLYFDGPLSALKNHTKLVIDIPGGGFVAMDPRAHDDKLFAWAGKTGLPVLSLDYRKAPEFPYPYALNECYDVYHTVIASRGRCIGLSGEVIPKIVLTGDSAGGNLATATILMILESGSTETRQHQGGTALPVPDGLVLMYPGLDLDISSWISDEQMSLIKDRRMRKLNRNMLRQKSLQYTHLAGTPHESEVEEDTPPKATSPLIPGEDRSTPTLSISTSGLAVLASQQYTDPEPSPSLARRVSIAPHQPAPLQTRLAMSSMISYFNDRILSPEMMRSMIILYIGPYARPDFSRDYLLSPILAPDSLLCKFPKTYFLTGERDPMVDDTVIFAGKLRRAKAAFHEHEAAEKGGTRKEFDDYEVVEVALIPGISHGFLQFLGVFPEGWKHLYRTARWIDEIFERAEEKEREEIPVTPGYTSGESRHHYRTRTESSGDEDFGLEMSMTSSKSKGKASPASKEAEKQMEETRRKKERLLKEHLEEKRESRRRPDGRGRGRVQRKKSMVTLASSDDLLGRRMLGLAGPLTGMGDG